MADRLESDDARDLLLVILAMRRGLIGPDQLFAAVDEWSRDHRQTMSGVLVGQGALDESSCAALGEMLGGGRGVPETIAYTGSSLRDGSDGEAGRAAVAAAIGERFRIVRTHARGGLGEVFLAIDPELDRRVAVKELRAHHAFDPTSQARFLLEARLTGRLEHPGIVPVYATGRYPDGRPYYAMRLIEGETLGDAIRRFHDGESREREPARREIAFRRLLRSLIDACNAVAYAHSRGVVHRDLKPANIMLGRFGETLVVDWGLAKNLSTPGADAESGPDRDDEFPDDPSSLTLPGAALGTPQYMSPEQASGDMDRVGPVSDVYGLGATLYCLLVGHGPFPSGEVADVLGRVRRGIFPAPRRMRRSIDPALEAICLKAMSVRPEDRYASPTSMAEEIEAWLADVRYRAEQDRALSDARRSLARLAVERAGRLFERGLIGDGMLWLARALENIPTDATGLERAVRASLGGWHAGSRAIERMLSHREAVYALAFSPDGRRLLTGCDDGTAQLWDVSTGARLAAAMRHGAAVRRVAFGPDGHLAVTASDDGRLLLWDAVTGAMMVGDVPTEVKITRPAGDVGDAIAPDGRTIAATAPDGTARLRDVATGRPIGEPMAHHGPIDRLVFHPEGTMVATAGRDGTARLWDAATGLAIGPPLEHRGAVRDLAFSPDGRRLATASADSMARCWRVPAPVAGDVERIACWVRVTTEREFDEGDAIGPMDQGALWELRRLLQDLGGPPMK